MGDMHFESKDSSQMQAVGTVNGTANLSVHINYAPQEIVVSGVGEHPPRYESYWVDRPAYETQLRDRIAQAPVIEIVAAGGFGKSSLAAWGFQQFKDSFERQVWINFRTKHPFDRFARYVLQEMDKPVTDPKATEEALLRELLLRLNDRKRPVKTLVVMDQLEAMQDGAEWAWYEQFLQRWSADGALSTVLVTSRSQTLAEAPINLGGFSVAEGAIFLETKKNLTQAEDGFGALVTLTQGHPLLLNLAAAWVQQTYGARVDDRAIDFFRKLFEQYQDDPTVGVEKIFGTVFEALPERLQQLLTKASVYRLPWTLEMAQAMLNTEMEGTFPAVETDDFSRNLRQIFLEATATSLRGLVERGLLERREHLFGLHPLVEPLVRSRLAEVDRTVAHETAIAFYQAHYQPWDGTLASCREVLEVFHHNCALGRYGQANVALDRCEGLLNLRGYYRDLLPLYEQLVKDWDPEDKAEQQASGSARTSLGNLYYRLGQYQQAIAAHKSAQQLFEQLNFAEGRAASLGNLGNLYYRLGQYQQAIDFYQQSLEIQRKLGDRQGEASSLGNLGNAYQSLGQNQRAIEFHLQHNEIARELGDRRGEATSLGNLGNAYDALGQNQRAIELYQQQNEIAREIGDRQGEANSLGGLGNAYFSLGQYQRAIDFYHQWNEIARELGDRQGEASSLGGLGNAYFSLGQYQRAIEFHLQHNEIAHELGDRQGEANSLGNLGNAYFSLGQYQRAIDLYQQHNEVARELGDLEGEANSLGNLGNAYDALGQYQRAIEFHQQSLELKRELGDRHSEATSHWNLNNVYQLRGQLKLALHHRHQAFRIWQELQLPLAALPLSDLRKRRYSRYKDHWVDNQIQFDNRFAWILDPIGYLLFIIRLLLSPLTKLQKRLRLHPLGFWFGIGLAIALLVWRR